MPVSENSGSLLHEELVARVAALDGKQSIIDGNRKTLAATVEALAECTTVDRTAIEAIADQLSVQSRFVGNNQLSTEQQRKLAKKTRLAKYIAIAAVVLFSLSMLKWLNVNSTLKAVLHDISSVQSRTADFRLRTGRYPHGFEMIGYSSGAPQFPTVQAMEMGPQGQLLISTAGFFGSQVLLTPVASNDGWSTWQCSTNASWLFTISGWLCEYQSSMQFSHLK